MIILIKLFLNSKLDLIQTVKFVKQLFRIQIQKGGNVLLWNQVKSRMEACYSELVLMLQVDFVLRGIQHESCSTCYLFQIMVICAKAKVGELTKLSFFSLYFDPDNFEVLIEGVSTGLKKTKTSKNKTQNLFTLS